MADLDSHLVEADPDSGWGRVVKDVTAGTCGGIAFDSANVELQSVANKAQVLSGQPFDTTKVRLQSAPEGTYTGTIDVVKKLVKNEGFKGFYKGTMTPLVGVGACVSIQFGVNEFMKRHFMSANMKKGHDPVLTDGQFYMSGMAAGMANAILACPIEHIRIRLQTQTTGPALYKGPIDCIRQISAASGLPGLFRGMGPTLLREGHGMGAYFYTFEALVKRDMASNNIERKDIPGWRLCLYGAGAGYAMWFTVYPIDVIKSKLQTDKLKPSQQVYSGSLDCAKKILATQGVQGFFRGFLPTILRAAPVNACTFFTFELVIRYLG